MAVTIPDLDISAKITDDDNSPNEYFEDLWHLVVLCCAQQQAAIEALQATVLDLQAQIDSFHP
jgi:hypothetical protein